MAHLRQKEVDDAKGVVQHDPIAHGPTLDVQGLISLFGKRIDYSSCQRFDMSVDLALAHEIKVGDRGVRAQIEGEGVYPLLFPDFASDLTEQLLGRL